MPIGLTYDECEASSGATFEQVLSAATLATRSDPNVERRLRLWMADCAARVLHIYEQTDASPAPRNAVVSARRYARGEIDAAALDVARDAALDAAWAAARAAGSTARDAAWAAEKEWQFARLVMWLSDDEPADWPLPELKQEN